MVHLSGVSPWPQGTEVHVVEEALDSERRMELHRASFAFDARMPESWGGLKNPQQNGGVEAEMPGKHVDNIWNMEEMWKRCGKNMIFTIKILMK